MDEDKLPKLKEAKDKPSLSKIGVSKETVVSQKSVASIILEDSDIEELTQEESLMDMGFLSHGEEGSDDDSQHPWMVSASKKQQKKQKKRKVMIATRTSTRVPKDGRTMMEKAVQRVQANEESLTGNSSSNQFLILNNLDNEHIHSVASELDLDIGDIDTQIDTFKAEEKVRAALAEANYKEYLEKLSKKTAPQGEEELEFALSVIDNSNREVGLVDKNEPKVPPPKGRGRPRKKQK